MRLLQRLSGSFLVLLLAACAAQQGVITPPAQGEQPAEPELPRVSAEERDALMSLVEAQDRLDRAAAPLLVQNAELCKSNARNLLGFTAKTKFSYSAEFVNAAQQVLHLNDRLQVTNVLPNSGAARAGMQRGDILISAAGQALPQGEDAEYQAAKVLGPLVNGHPGVALTVLRDGKNVELNIPLTHACAFGVKLGNADNVNAYADGSRVLVTRGMLRFAKTDDEVAYVLASEMAHNILGHPQKQRMVATMDSIIDNLIRVHPDLSGMTGASGVKVFPEALDVAADSLAMYLLARAGYDINGAPAFWQSLATAYPAASVPNGYTAIHPATAARISAMKKAIADIRNKQANKQPLLPG